MLKDWHHWIGTFTGVVLITVAALPLAAQTPSGPATPPGFDPLAHPNTTASALTQPTMSPGVLLLMELEGEHPGVKQSMLKALGNVAPRHLLDTRLNPPAELRRRAGVLLTSADRSMLPRASPA